ncbi:MAG: type I methionyl aminopeptidase, partial [Abditibacteriota bacterium]|nr:type I methionyl aminopeptidase [Abditibacteriota bacterium]
MIKKKKASEIEKMRVAGAVVGNCLRELAAWIEPGKTTTLEMDKKADELVRSYGAIPSFKNYNGYPNSVCIAVNEEVVHGIPGGRVLMPGDVVGIDLGAIVDGWHGDSAITVLVDDCGSNEARKLLQVTRDALYKGIEQARPGKRLSDIGHAIQEYVEDAGFSVVRDLVGHGIGRNMHEDPYVPNYGRPG